MLAHLSRIIHNIDKERATIRQKAGTSHLVIRRQSNANELYPRSLADAPGYFAQKQFWQRLPPVYCIKKAGSQGNRLMSITNNAPYKGSIAEPIHRSHHVVFVVVSPITSLRWYDPDQVQRVRNLMRFRLSPDNSDSPSNVNKLQHLSRKCIFNYAGPVEPSITE